MNKYKEIAMRNAFGKVLLDLADKKPQMVVLDADVSSSTQTIHFGKKYPERFFNIGVAEANMVDIGGGLATCGLHPVVSTFAIFLTLKTTDQIRNVLCYNNLPVILVGGYAGLSDSFDGASHQSITDIAVMRAMPNMKVLVPADASEMKQAVKLGLEEKGPVYIRSCRNATPELFENSAPMEMGKARKIRDGKDLTIAVCGVPTYMAMEAAEKLESEGISVDLLSFSTIKPLDEKAIVESISKTGKILSIEEHSIIGGLGSAVAEVLAKSGCGKMDSIGIQDKFTETGPYMELLEKYGISVNSIIEKAKRLIDK